MRKWFWIGLLAALLGGGIWAGRLFWRARNDLVSLDVSNMPVEQVIESLRRQTGETILADTNLHAKISLHLRNVSLSEALNRVGAQAGALAGTIHAIYFTSQSFDALKRALRHGRTVETAGWTNLAPIFDLPRLPLDPGSAPAGALAVQELPPGSGPRITEDVRIMGPGGGEGPAGPAAKQDIKRHAGAPMMVMRFQKAGADGKAETEIWSPERIVARSDLAQRLSGLSRFYFPRPGPATASKLKAYCQTLYALKRAPGGMAPGGMDKLTRAPASLVNRDGPTPDGGKLPPNENVEAMIRREKLAQYQDLTPQQRVERLRELRSGEEKKN